MASRSQRIAISRLGRSKAAGNFLGLSRGAGFTARSDPSRPLGGAVVFSCFELRAVFSRAAIHEPVLGVRGSGVVCVSYRRSIRARDGSQY